METESLSYKTLKNSSYTFLNYVIPIVFSIAITPVVVRRLGAEDYGIYILLNTIMAFLALLDLGLATALIKYISYYAAEANHERLKKLIASANTMYVIIGTMGFLLYLVLGKYFLSIFHIPAQNQPHIFIVFLLGGLVFFVSTVNSVYTTTPAALQRYDISAKLSLSQLTIANICILIAVLLGYKLKVIVAINLLTIVAVTFAYRWYYKKLLPNIPLRLGWDKQEIKKAYSFGVLAAVTNLASNSLIQLDRFVIPIFLGPASLSYYSLPGNVGQKTAGITGSAAGILFPLTSALSAVDDREKISHIYHRAFRNITLVAAAITAAIILFAYRILFYWLGKDFADKGTNILIILALTYFFLALYAPLSNFLLGLGKVKFLMVFSIFLALLNIILLIILVPRFGITGAAWAYLGGVLPIPAAFYWTEKKYLKLTSFASFYAKLYAKLAVTAAVFVVIVKFVFLPLTHSLTVLLVSGPLSVVVFFALYYIFGFMDAEDTALFKSFWLSIRKRLKIIN